MSQITLRWSYQPSPRPQAASYGDEIRSSKRKAEQLHRLWAQRDSKDMDTVYSQLLRAGKANTKRHHELTGALADVEMAQSPEVARSVAPLLRAVALPQSQPATTGDNAVRRPVAAISTTPKTSQPTAPITPATVSSTASVPPPVAAVP